LLGFPLISLTKFLLPVLLLLLLSLLLLFCYVNRPEIFLWKFRFSFGWKKRRLNDVILLLLFREGTRYHVLVRSGCMPIVLWMGQRDVHFPTGFDYITRNGRNIKRIERETLDGQF
jgi:hypothetical protein